MQQVTVFIDLQDSSTCFGQTLPIIRSVKLQITACGMVSCCGGGLAVRRAAAWYYVLGVKEDA
jgi:hypothetical protein